MLYTDLEESVQMDSSLDLDGKLLEENYGKNVNESYNVEDLYTPISQN